MVIGLGSTVLTTVVIPIIVGNITEQTKDISFLQKLVSGYKFIVTQCVRFININIKLWVIALTIGGIYGVYKLLRWLIKPPFTNFKEAKFKRWIWKWEWATNEYGIGPINLQCFCPKCDVNFIRLTGYTNKVVRCPECGDTYSDTNRPGSEFIYEHEAETEALIISRARKMSQS